MLEPSLLETLKQEHRECDALNCEARDAHCNSCIGRAWPCPVAQLVTAYEDLQREVEQTQEIAVGYAELYADAVSVAGALEVKP